MCRLAFAVIALLSLGCSQSGQQAKTAVASDVPYVTGEALDRLLADSEGPTVLEFCVPVGCFRCDQMRPQINALAEAEGDRLTVRRVNLHTDQQLAAKWGVTVCPSYVVVHDGQEVGRSAYPTSADLVLAMIPQQPVAE